MTNTWAIYGHVRNLRPWQSELQRCGLRTTDHPFSCDRAAVHQILEEGWMWQLPFDHGVTSVGIVFDRDTVSRGSHNDGQHFWKTILRKYPSLDRQFRHSEWIAPGNAPVTTTRLQRLWSSLAGEDYVLLPGTAGFVDPLHSTGIAQSLSGVRTLARILGTENGTGGIREELQAYANLVASEIRMIDRLVATCLQVRRHPELFEAATMLYFTAAIRTEERLLRGECPAFLSIDEPEIARMLQQGTEFLLGKHWRTGDALVIWDEIGRLIAPWNVAGLLNRRAHHMYRYTAVDKK